MAQTFDESPQSLLCGFELHPEVCFTKGLETQASLLSVTPAVFLFEKYIAPRDGEWKVTADHIENSWEKTIAQKRVTYDFHRLMEGATKLETFEFATAIIENT